MRDIDKLPDYETTLQIVACDVVDERIRQHEKWGTQRHHWPMWVSILTEELGEAATEANKCYWAEDDGAALDHLLRLRTELVQTAAVAVAIIEHIDEVKP